MSDFTPCTRQPYSVVKNYKKNGSKCTQFVIKTRKNDCFLEVLRDLCKRKWGVIVFKQEIMCNLGRTSITWPLALDPKTCPRAVSRSESPKIVLETLSVFAPLKFPFPYFFSGWCWKFGASLLNSCSLFEKKNLMGGIPHIWRTLKQLILLITSASHANNALTSFFFSPRKSWFLCIETWNKSRSELFYLGVSRKQKSVNDSSKWHFHISPDFKNFQRIHCYITIAIIVNLIRLLIQYY